MSPLFRISLCAGLALLGRQIFAAEAAETSIIKFGAVADGTTLNTKAIQETIDSVAAKGGGTVLVPKGTFLSGALFLKPGVSLHLAEEAVLKGSDDLANYPKANTRIEGHFEPWIPALINAEKVDHLRITGPGTLDGNGATFWDAFWAARKVNPKVTNLAVERPRLAFIQNCTDVQISGVNFKDSGFWNLHLYRCRDVLVEKVRFAVPAGLKCPSTDGIDVDSSQNVTIRGCSFAVDDDCICLKGSKGPFAMDDKDSPPVEHIRVSDCTFERGGGVTTLGSEATIVRDVVVENCKVLGRMSIARLKLRGDTPQHYEDIHYKNLTLDGAGPLLQIRPWSQFFDLKGQPEPTSIVKNVTMSGIKGSYNTLGTIVGNKETQISDITLENIDLTLKDEKFEVGAVKNLEVKNVTVNGKPFTLK